jgi:hypothetical protein
LKTLNLARQVSLHLLHLILDFLDGEDNRMFTRTGKIQSEIAVDYEKRVSGYFGGGNLLTQNILSNPDLISTEQTKAGKEVSNLSIAESENNKSQKASNRKNLNDQLDLAGTFTESQRPKKGIPVVSLTPRADPEQFIVFNTEQKSPRVDHFGTSTANFKGRKNNSNLQPNGKRTMTVIFDVKQPERADRNNNNATNNSFITLNDQSKGPVVNKKFGKNTQPNNVSRVPQKPFWKEAGN